MKNFTLLSLFFALLFSSVFSQTAFMRGYGDAGGADLFFGSVEAIDGGFYFLGRSESFGQGDVDAIVMKTDSVGDPVWTTNFGTTNFNEAFVSAWEGPDGSLYVFGHQTVRTGRENMLLVKFTSAGQVVWHKKIGDANSGFDEQARTLLARDNYLYLIGTTQGTDSMDRDNGYILKFDLDGNNIWANAYGTNGREQYRDASISANGNFKCVGTIKLDPSLEWGDAMVSEVDSAGNLIWMKAFGTSEIEWLDTGTELSDGSIIGAGFRITNGQRDYFVVRTTATGGLLWAKSYGGPGEDRCYNLKELPNGNIACAGISNSFGTGDQNVFLLIIDPQGAIVKAVTYGGTMDETAFHLTVTSDQALLMSGWSDSPSLSQGLNDFMAIKVAISGASDKICPNQLVTGLVQDSVIQVVQDSGGYRKAVYMEQPLMPDNQGITLNEKTVCLRVTSIEDPAFSSLTIYPNPAKHALQVALPETSFGRIHYEIIDLAGKVVLSAEAPRLAGNLQIPIGHLSSGMYLLQMKDQDGQTWSSQWIKE